MTGEGVWRRLAVYAAVSAALWASAVGVLFWYLRRTLSAEAKAKPWTDADSIGLPVVGFAVWSGLALVLANLVLAAVALWKRRMRTHRG